VDDLSIRGIDDVWCKGKPPETNGLDFEGRRIREDLASEGKQGEGRLLADASSKKIQKCRADLTTPQEGRCSSKHRREIGERHRKRTRA